MVNDEIVDVENSDFGSIELNWFQRRRYIGRFIAIYDGKVFASGRNYWECRHNARRKSADSPIEIRKNLRYDFVEKNINYYRALFIFSTMKRAS